MDAHGPGGAAAGVAGGLVRGECDVAESDRAAVVQDAIDVCRRVLGLGAVGEVGASTGFDDRDVASMTMYLACVSRRICALPASWSEWAWLMRRILTSLQ